MLPGSGSRRGVCPRWGGRANAIGMRGQLWHAANMSVYYFGLDRKNSIFEKGVGRTIRHTIGSRSWRTTRAWDFNFEAIAQWGSPGSFRRSIRMESARFCHSAIQYENINRPLDVEHP